jgi:hypothetical protein
MIERDNPIDVDVAPNLFEAIRATTRIIEPTLEDVEQGNVDVCWHCNGTTQCVCALCDGTTCKSCLGAGNLIWDPK